ncbi:unnamed protein product, partial [Darwinula stevensoni]
IDQSASCEQRIRYDCSAVVPNEGDTPYSWWLDRHGRPRYHWDEADAVEHASDCGLSHDSIDPTRRCNNDARALQQEADIGIIADPTALPIVELRFGGVQTEGQKANHTLGGLVCRGRATPSANPPTSCSSLRRAGNTGTGYHLIGKKRGRLDVVLCRMDLEETDPGFQLETDAFIQQGGVYFDAYRTTSWDNWDWIIPFDGTEVNIGEAMDPSTGIFTAPQDGIYAFHLHCWTRVVNHTPNHPQGNLITIRKNGEEAAELITQEIDINDNQVQINDQMPGQSILLDLSVGDEVDIFLNLGETYADFSDPGRSLHFVGYLLYPL